LVGNRAVAELDDHIFNFAKRVLVGPIGIEAREINVIRMVCAEVCVVMLRSVGLQMPAPAGTFSITFKLRSRAIPENLSLHYGGW
jgi:hypothetical protein